MNYNYWIPKRAKRSPALQEVEKSLKSDKKAKRIYDKRLLVFADTPYELMIDLGQITPFRKSRWGLHEWKVEFGRSTGRVFFVISQGTASFLHFFVKKSARGSKIPPRNLRIAEDRAAQFRSEELEEKNKHNKK